MTLKCMLKIKREGRGQDSVKGVFGDLCVLWVSPLLYIGVIERSSAERTRCVFFTVRNRAD